jgi:transglutaminase-like putative cysteine protease
MKLKNLLLVFTVLLSSGYVIGQSNSDTNFASFAAQQGSLFDAAYKKRDVEQYKLLLREFLKRYESLDKDQQKQFAPYYVNAFYNLSCTYSLLNNKEMALINLDKAIKAGYVNYAHILQDSDLDNIRNDKTFTSIIQPLREVGDYLYILKKDNNRFTTSDSIQIPSFTYQSADNPGLTHLRQQFKLDSVAGTGNEVSKIINILHWVHNTVPHDGQHESGIQSINGFEIVSVSRTKNIGVSCGELATVLNDCYLALGFKSRKIYCQPKDSLNMDYDAHVINAVYSTQLKKWLWMDPTNDAYVMNEKGELLGIDEVRNRLINDQPLIVNPDANWNHKQSTTKDYYLYYYMAKNLYRFYCTLESGFDVETKGEEKTITYVNLVPIGYGKFKQVPAKMQFYNKNLKTTFVHYTTHNPKVFWQVP